MICLLDTNAIIDYLGGVIPASAMANMHSIVNEGFFISIITKIETLGFSSDNAEVDANTAAFVSLATVFELTPEVAQTAIELKRVRKIITPDAIIAATALIHNLALLTRNNKDFKNMEGLAVIDPHTLE
jgi:predicted nucleic acid-binding protein